MTKEKAILIAISAMVIASLDMEGPTCDIEVQDMIITINERYKPCVDFLLSMIQEVEE